MPSMAWIPNVPEFTHRIRGHLVFEGTVSSRCEGAVSQDVLKVLLEKGCFRGVERGSFGCWSSGYG